MIKKLKLGLLVATLSLFAVASVASAANLTWSSDDNVTINGNDYVIRSGSGATQMDVNSTTLVVIVPASTTFTLASLAGNTLTNVDGSSVVTAQSCSGSVNTVAYTGSGTITFTPTTVRACGSSGGGSSGGGSTTTDTTAPTSTSVSVNAGLATTSSLSSTLTLGATGATQMLISNDSGFAGASWETYATSKAWTLTSGDGAKTVYAKFKDAAGNTSAAVSDTITVSGSGTVIVVPPPSVPTGGCSGGNLYNPSTGALCVNNAGDQIPGCGNRNTGFSSATGGSCALNRVTVVVATSYNFGTTTLKNGSKGEAVKELQRFLNAKLNLGLVVDGRLGPKTIAVIKKWQKDNALVADGLVGPKTKAMMNAQ